MNNATANELRERLNEFNDDYLIQQVRNGELTDLGLQIASEILRERNVNVEEVIREKEQEEKHQKEQFFLLEQNRAIKLWRSRWLYVFHCCTALALNAIVILIASKSNHWTAEEKLIYSIAALVTGVLLSKELTKHFIANDHILYKTKVLSLWILGFIFFFLNIIFLVIASK